VLKIPKYRGVFSKDKLPEKIWSKGECGIVNLEDFDAGDGTHWVAYSTEPPSYFDSFGDLPPPLSLKKYLGPGIVYNVNRVQNYDQVTCGHLCLYFLFTLSRTGSYERTIDDLLKK